MRGKYLMVAMTVGFTLAGCQSGPPIAPVTTAPSAVTMGEEVAPIALDRMQVALRWGTIIGQYISHGQWTSCYSEEDQVVWGGTREIIQDQELSDIFHDEMTAAGYEVVGNPDELFADTSVNQTDPEFLIGGRIDSVQMNLCRGWNGWVGGYTGDFSGDAKIGVTWQVFSLLEGNVVYETRTEGYVEQDDGVPEGDYLLLANAFAAAAANLAADRGFHTLLSSAASNAPSVAASEPAPSISLRALAPLAGGIGENIALIDRSVVTILLGDGHGSGFFVSPTLLLTNHHVAGNRDQVRIQMSDGTQAIARLVRTDALRDVALLEIETPVSAGLPLRTTLPGRAETVYAVGSPDDTGLAGTITRGIVSQIHEDQRGVEWIQADVGVHAGSSGGPLLDEAGNVVGIAAWGRVGAGGDTMGLNFFAPIGDALRILGIRLSGQTL
ncbi:MAG: S1C family serine protease [Dongiaceae bacterium]